MKGYVVEARYAPEITAAISNAMRQIEYNRKQRVLGGDKDYVEVDDSLKGNIVVIVGESDTKPDVVRWGGQTQNVESAA